MQNIDELYTKVKLMNGKVETLGYTHLNNPIILVRKGKRENNRGKILMVGAIHAREYITSYLLSYLASNYNGDYPIDFIPLLNPDGVFLARQGISYIKDKKLKNELLDVNKSKDFALWKANAKSVDLNVNYDADWGCGLGNVRYKSPSSYIGAYPNSEEETQAILTLLEKNNYIMALSYHCKGEEIYWGYNEDTNYKEEASEIARHLKYELKQSVGSCGGLKDYYTLIYKRLGLTIEIGNDRFSHPFPLSELDNIISQHKDSLELIVKIAKRLEQKKGY